MIPLAGRHWSCAQKALGSVVLRTRLVAERLQEDVRRAAGKIGERGENEDAGEAVADAAVHGDVLDRGAEAELVSAAHEGGGLDRLHVVFGARGIEQRRLSEADHAGDFDFGAARIRNQIERAAGELEAQFVDETRSADGLPAGGERLVQVVAGAAGGLVGEVVAAQHFALDSRAGDGVARHQFLGLREAVGQLEGSLKGRGFGGEVALRHGRNSGAREGREGERGIDGGAETAAGNFGVLLAGFVFALDGGGEKRTVATQRAVESGLGLVLAAIGFGGRSRLRIAGFEEGVGGEQVDVAMEAIGAGERDYVEIAAGPAAEFGGHVGGRDAELHHRLLTHGDAAGTGGFVAIIQAVDGQAVVARAHAGEGEAAVGRRAADAGLGAERIRAGGGRDSGGEQDHAQVAAILRRSFFQGLAADAGARGRRGGIDGVGLFADVDGAAGAREFELQVRLQGLVQREVDFVDFGALESGLFTADSVRADGEGGDAVTAVGTGAGGANRAGGIERGGDAGIGNDGARGIDDQALNGSLSVRRAGKQHQYREETHQ